MTTEATAETQGSESGAAEGAQAQTALDSGVAETKENENTGEGESSSTSQESEQGESSEQKTGQESDGDSQDDQESKTPTEYSEFTLPEGMEVNEEAMGEFKEFLGEIQGESGQALSQEQAQEIVDMGSNIVQQAVEDFKNHLTEQQAQRTEEWIKTFKDDPEIGGTEEKQKQVLSEAKRVVKAVGGDALLNAINETGAGNHPEIIRAFFKIKDVVGEDGKVIISNQGGGETTLAQRLYPNQQT